MPATSFWLAVMACVNLSSPRTWLIKRQYKDITYSLPVQPYAQWLGSTRWWQHPEAATETLCSVTVLVIDEVGYLSYSNRHADLLFEIINRRYEQRSTLVTTNRPFSERGEVYLRVQQPIIRTVILKIYLKILGTKCYRSSNQRSRNIRASIPFDRVAVASQGDKLHVQSAVACGITSKGL